jgi:hypothetical protein
LDEAEGAVSREGLKVMSEDQDRLLEMIRAAQPQLAKFARESYALHGRGIVHVEFPSVPPGVTALVSTQMIYQDLAEMRRLIGELSHNEEASITLRMIETYDSERQAVVMAAFRGGNPITIKMKLDSPTFIDDAGGVH